ncbi:hypothetical protein D9C73_000345 [Collichthys lucidus]|uniref:Uncharacterized protein n=1 Tax=Collichthys lucidus TaxID=240159 RepID=A0A4U5TXX2_COLLU|nr:hypothetical protein D9C73_000345 [Collichthys lucidus]
MEAPTESWPVLAAGSLRHQNVEQLLPPGGDSRSRRRRCCIMRCVQPSPVAAVKECLHDGLAASLCRGSL